MISRRGVLAAAPALWLGCGRRRAEPDAAQRLLDAPERADAMALVAERVRAGEPLPKLWLDVVAALMRFEGELHTRLATVSMYLLAADEPLALLWATDMLKVEQPFAAPAEPLARVGDLRKVARPTLQRLALEALEAEDMVLLSRIVRAVREVAGFAEARELLYRLAAREDGAGGHGTMYAIQAPRLAAGVGYPDVDRLLDGCAQRLVPEQWRPPLPKTVGPRYRALVERAARLPLDGSGHAEVRALLDAARTASRPDLLDDVVTLLEAGESPAACWDGLRLAAAERAAVDDLGRRGLHAFDTLAAMRFAASNAKTPRTRALLLLQAGERLPGFGRPSGRLRIDEAPAPQADGVEIRRRVLEKAGVDWHGVKYPVAVLEEAAAAEPWAAARIRGAVYGHLPREDSAGWSQLDYARSLLRG